MDERMDEKKKTEQPERRVIDLAAARAQREEEAERKETAATPPGGGHRRLALLLIVIAVLAVVILVLFGGKLNFDGIRRTFSYMGTEQTTNGQTRAFEYTESSDNCFANLNGDLAFVSNNQAVLYAKDGGELYSQNIQMKSPALVTGGTLAVAYDIGGSSLVAFSAAGEQMKLTLDGEMGYYAVSVNRSDWIAVTAQKQNAKGCVMVYNANMDQVFEFDSSSRFVAAAYVTEDCKYLLAQTLGQENGVFESQMVAYQLSSEQPYAAFSVSDGMVLSIGSIGNQSICVADNQAVISTPGGQVGATYTYPQPYLRAYSTAGSGFAVLALNRYRAGANGQLVTINASGEEIGVVDTDEEILDLSAADRYVAALYTDRLVIYNKDLSEYASVEAPAAQHICMRADGSVWLIDADEISLLIP